MGQQLSFKRKHCGVAPVHGPWSRISKTSHLKLKREVSRTEKRFKIAIMFSGRRRRSREERNGFVKADVVMYRKSSIKPPLSNKPTSLISPPFSEEES